MLSIFNSLIKTDFSNQIRHVIADSNHKDFLISILNFKTLSKTDILSLQK